MVNLDVIDLSAYIVDKSKNEITNLKLQKILYYFKGYFLKYFNEEIFLDDIYCWQYGPVVPSAYYRFSRYGSQFLPASESGNVYFDSDHLKLAQDIIDKCEKYKTSELVEKTHNELPWKSVQIGQKIPKNIISSFFKNYDPLEIKYGAIGIN